MATLSKVPGLNLCSSCFRVFPVGSLSLLNSGHQLAQGATPVLSPPLKVAHLSVLFSCTCWSVGISAAHLLD